MSGTNKTGDKLVASIRKTKAGATKPGQAAPAKSTRPSRASAAKPVAAREQVSGVTHDAFTSGQRVWPD